MKWMTVLAMVAALGLVSAAFAADREAPKAEKPTGVTGKIVKVETAVITVRTTENKEVGLETSGKIDVTVDGKEAKVTDLKVGMNVVITWGTGTDPMKVVATTK